MKPNVIVINEKDNVAVALEDIDEGETVHLPDGGEFNTLENISFSHKVAVRGIPRGQDIVKYGEVIGQAGEDIKRGGWVHAHNLVIEE